MTASTSEILTTAATIAARFEHRGQSISTAEAIDRAIAAREQMAQLKAMQALDWADTVQMPPYDPALLAEVAA